MPQMRMLIWTKPWRNVSTPNGCSRTFGISWTRRQTRSGPTKRQLTWLEPYSQGWWSPSHMSRGCQRHWNTLFDQDKVSFPMKEFHWKTRWIKEAIQIKKKKTGPNSLNQNEATNLGTFISGCCWLHHLAAIDSTDDTHSLLSEIYLLVSFDLYCPCIQNELC